MDLSAVIFVVLALAWAVYLIPKALKHHDEMASDRLVEGHSDRVRILRRKTVVQTDEVTVEAPAESSGKTRPSRRERRKSRPPASPARRRRRVLGVLLLAAVVVTGLAYTAFLPWWSTAIPGAMVLGFLVVARFSVRRSSSRGAQRSSLAQRRPAGPSMVEEPVLEPTASEQPVDVDLHEPDPAADVLADDGSLWDPLPMTLPTYVNKARARRTVRTIELTGMQSSGHDEEASALARGAETSASEQAAETESVEGERRAAGA